MCLTYKICPICHHTVLRLSPAGGAGRSNLGVFFLVPDPAPLGQNASRGGEEAEGTERNEDTEHRLKRLSQAMSGEATEETKETEPSQER